MERPAATGDPVGMANRHPLTDEETADAASERASALSFQREALEHLSEWLRYRSLKQKHIANALNKAEGTVSRYVSGQTLMPFGYLYKIAFLLDCKAGDLFKAPPASGLAPLVEETLAEMARVGPERWQRILAAAKDMKSQSEE